MYLKNFLENDRIQTFVNRTIGKLYELFLSLTDLNCVLKQLKNFLNKKNEE